MRVLIIEDESPASRRLTKLIREVRPDVEIIGVLESVKVAIKWFEENEMPDLILSDIQLSDDLSFSIYKNIEVTAPIIFITAFDQYAIQAFEHLSVDYLLKPIRKENLQKALEKLEKLKPKNESQDLQQLLNYLQKKKVRERFLVYHGENLLSLPADNIAYFYSEQGLTFINTHEGQRYIFNESLDKVEKEVDDTHFFRANRQFIVNICSVLKVSPYFNQKLKVFLKPDPKIEVLVSKLKASDFKMWLNS